MNDENVLIDTSIWIDYFQNKPSSISRKVDNILSENDIYIPKIVIAELIQGSGSQKEVLIVADFLNTFNIIDQKKDTWIEAGKLSYRLRKKGKTVNLADCYIAIIAKAYECCIFTLDKHFKYIRSEININLL